MKFLLKRRLPKEEKRKQEASTVESHIQPSSIKYSNFNRSFSSKYSPTSQNFQVSLTSNITSQNNFQTSYRNQPVAPLCGDFGKSPVSMTFPTVNNTPLNSLPRKPNINSRLSSSARTLSPSPHSSPHNSFVSRKVSQPSEPASKNTNSEEETPFDNIPLLDEVNPSNYQELLIQKLDACCTVYNFNSDSNLCGKELKRQTLLELLKFISETSNCFTDQIMQHIVKMVAMNIFRTLLPSTTHTLYFNSAFDPEEEDHATENSWPHLQLVYELFLRFIASSEIDPKIVKRYVDQQFVLKLLDLFKSEDPRERDYLKTILHRIYGKIMALRTFIRRAMQHTFYEFVYEHECHKGVCELLEILGSIINGFALPLKEEHKIFLERSLIPLHKAKSFNSFNQQLAYCMTQYVEKDKRVAEIIIKGLLRYWPVTNTTKEVAFLNELEEILELTQSTEFQKVMIPLFQQLGLCIQSPHFQVAERALFFWNNEYIVTLFSTYKEQLFPLFIPALYRNSKDHWNSTVHGLTFNVSRLLANVDPDLFDEYSNKSVANEESRLKNEEYKLDKWNQIEKQLNFSTK